MISAPNAVVVSVAAAEFPSEDLLRQLHGELRRAGIPSEQVSGAAEPGTKSTAGAVVSLVVAGLLSAAGLRAMSQVLVAAIQRSDKRKIEIRRGDDVLILEGPAVGKLGPAMIEDWLRRDPGSA